MFALHDSDLSYDLVPVCCFHTKSRVQRADTGRLSRSCAVHCVPNLTTGTVWRGIVSQSPPDGEEQHDPGLSLSSGLYRERGREKDRERVRKTLSLSLSYFLRVQHDDVNL